MPPRVPKPRLLDPTVLVADVALDREHVIVATQYDTPLSIVAHDGTGRRVLVETGGFSRVVADDRGMFAAGKPGVVHVDKAGTVSVLAPHQPWDLVLSETHVYGSLLGSYPAYADGGVFRVPRGGGDIEWLVRGRSVTALCAAGDAVYFASNNVLHRARGDASAQLDVLGPARNPHAIVSIGEVIAWTEFDEHGAPSALVDGEIRPLAAQSYTSDLIVLDGALYWTQANRKKSQPAIWRMRIGDEAPEPSVRFAGKSPRLAGTPSLLVWCGDSRGGVYASDKL